MIPTAREIAAQLTVMVESYPDKTTSEIAQEMGYSPLFIINGINYAVREGWLVNDKENDKLSLGGNLLDFEEDNLFGAENTALQDAIVRAVTDANSDKNDIEEQQMKFWLVGVRPFAIEIALDAIERLGFVKRYKLSDPYDKESVYTFLTLPNHKSEQWGLKQFKDPKGKSKSEK